MTVPLLRRLVQLAEAGATIIGRAPVASPSLADDPQEFTALVQRLWSGRPSTEIGLGRVIASKNLDEALAAIGVVPDFSVGSTASTVPTIEFVHRQSEREQVYFVRNPSNAPKEVEARFRVTGKIPELWKADAGSISEVSYRIENGQTVVPLNFEGEESYFIVFRKPAKEQSMIVPEERIVPIARLDADWYVSFQSGRGAPRNLELPSLRPLNENADAGIRYFSGVATYRTRFTAPYSTRAAKSLLIDLGQVGDLAEVLVNGKLAGTVWHAPYRVDISRYIKAGSNVLEVRVANLWANRLIGDAQPGSSKVAWTATPMYRADAPLRPSGLIGPVQLMSQSPRGASAVR